MAGAALERTCRMTDCREPGVARPSTSMPEKNATSRADCCLELRMQPHAAGRTDRDPTLSTTGVGARLRRKEDARFLRGRGQYIGDIRFPRMREVAFADWVFSINGERMFLKGANLVPARPGLADVSRELVRADVERRELIVTQRAHALRRVPAQDVDEMTCAVPLAGAINLS